MRFAFELGTSRQSARSYLFAAETSEDRQQWMTMLAKVRMIFKKIVAGLTVSHCQSMCKFHNVFLYCAMIANIATS